MYGEAMQANRTTPGAPPAPNQECLSDINSETAKILYEVMQQLDYLITKHVGPRPAATSGENAKEVSRSLRFDANVLRKLAHEIAERVQELHNQLGYN